MHMTFGPALVAAAIPAREINPVRTKKKGLITELCKIHTFEICACPRFWRYKVYHDIAWEVKFYTYSATWFLTLEQSFSEISDAEIFLQADFWGRCWWEIIVDSAAQTFRKHSENIFDLIDARSRALNEPCLSFRTFSQTYLSSTMASKRPGRVKASSKA